MKIKRAFILGAGASISHANGNFPGISEIFKYAMKLGVIDKGAIGEYQNLFDYIEKKYNYSIFDKRRNIDAEKILTLLEIDLSNKYESADLSLRESILKLIVDVIDKQQAEIQLLNGDYDHFSEHLTFSDLIITFNWDTLLDYALQKYTGIKATPGRSHWNALERNFIYGKAGEDSIVNLTNVRASNFADPQPIESEWEPIYLKMHGSIDWITCENELCPARGYLFRNAGSIQSYRCGHCYELMGTVIIPPVLNKSVSKIAAIRRIWNYANRSIRDVEEIVIWGYSLPPTDFYSENLLRMVRKSTLKKVDIINPSVVYEMHSGYRRNNQFIKRFEDVFGLKHGDQLRLFTSFSNWNAGNSINKS